MYFLLAIKAIYFCMEEGNKHFLCLVVEEVYVKNFTPKSYYGAYIK